MLEFRDFKDDDRDFEYDDNNEILQLIYENEYDKLKSMGLKAKNLNFRAEHTETDLDDRITPLAAAAFLGRWEIVALLLENPMLDIDMQTEETGLTPLSAA